VPPEASPNAELTQVVHRNIRALLTVQREFERKKSAQDKLADSITTIIGSLYFVYIQLVFVCGWIALNARLFRVEPFDPFPFVMLAMITSVEAIFLSTFVLISQNRQAAMNQRRADLDLQINLGPQARGRCRRRGAHGRVGAGRFARRRARRDRTRRGSRAARRGRRPAGAGMKRPVQMTAATTVPGTGAGGHGSQQLFLGEAWACWLGAGVDSHHFARARGACACAALPRADSGAAPRVRRRRVGTGPKRAADRCAGLDFTQRKLLRV
jgi:hypothetical protein